jgi:hypothetical protein
MQRRGKHTFTTIQLLLETVFSAWSVLRSYLDDSCGDPVSYKALIRSVMSYACPAWELAADTYLFKLQRLRNKVLPTIGHFPRCTPVRDLHTAFILPYVYNYITKLCRQQVEVVQNHENEHVRDIGQGEDRHRKYKDLNLAVVKLTTVQVT